MTGYWRELHEEELPDLSSSSCIIRMAESRSAEWVWKRREMYKKFRQHCLGEVDHQEDLGLDARTLLKWILKK
jgi:hypothetical protein